jgi:hypothetical protein
VALRRRGREGGQLGVAAKIARGPDDVDGGGERSLADAAPATRNSAPSAPRAEGARAAAHLAGGWRRSARSAAGVHWAARR